MPIPFKVTEVIEVNGEDLERLIRQVLPDQTFCLRTAGNWPASPASYLLEARPDPASNRLVQAAWPFGQYQYLVGEVLDTLVVKGVLAPGKYLIHMYN